MPPLSPLEELIRTLRERLRPVCLSSAQVEAEVSQLLESVLGITPSRRYGDLGEPLEAPRLERLEALLRRRIEERTPLQYLLGEAAFYGLTLQVGPAVLIPRPETELLAEQAIQACRKTKHRPCRVLDLGTGSGGIALAIKHTLGEDVTVIATDISEEALAVARANAGRLGLPVEFRRGDGLEPVSDECFDVIVSNPPYIDTAEMSAMQPEVLHHEPHLALFPAARQRQRLYFYRLLAEQGVARLARPGVILAELGENMDEAARLLFAARGFDEVAVLPDYGGVPRILRAVLKARPTG